MVPLLLLLTLLLAPSLGLAPRGRYHDDDEHEAVHLWPGTPPDESGEYGPEAVTPEADPTRFIISNITDPRFDVWPAPPGRLQRGAAVLVVPGGGYTCVSITAEGEEIAAWLNSLGLTAFVLKYRVPGRPGVPFHWVAQEDAQRAAGVIRARRAEWGLDAGEAFRLGAIGFSAGGHCVATLAANPRERLYERVDASDDLRCGQDFTMLVYPAFVSTTSLDRVSETVVVPKGERVPPTFGVQAEDDFCTPDNVLAYMNYARRHGAKAEVHVYPEGGHGYGLRPTQFEVCTWPQRAEAWLRHQKIIV